MLELTNVNKTFAGSAGPVVAVRDLSLSVAPGEFVAIQGASGCGKSTLLLMAGGLLTPDTGSVRLQNSDVYKLGTRERGLLRASAVGFVFQQFHLIPYLSVLDNILVPAIPLPGSSAGTRAHDAITRFGLDSRAGHVPAKLSVGEQQRTALARAMINNPAFILADEPTGNLDPENAAIVMKALVDFAASGGGVLLVTHDERAAGFARTRYRMAGGVLSAV